MTNDADTVFSVPDADGSRVERQCPRAVQPAGGVTHPKTEAKGGE